MKTNKEFIEGIYQKADEISAEKKVKKQLNIRKITNIAAVLIIAIALGININETQNKKQNESIDLGLKVNEDRISLKTVDTFQNFCTIIKNSNVNKTNANLSYSDGMMLEATNSVSQDSASYKTNTQVENVDEADIVKVQENFIYYVSGKKVVIIETKNSEEATKIAEISYEGQEFSPQEIYVNNDKLIVIGRQFDVSTCYIAYEDVLVSKSKTFIMIYDITNKNQPAEIRRVEIEGDYVSSRMIEDNIYFAVNKMIYNSEILKNEISTLDETMYKPKYKDTVVSENEKYVEYDSIYCFEKIETTDYLILGGINLEKNEEVELQTFLGAGNYIYASDKNMYIAKTNTEYGENYEYVSSNTHILRFSLNKGKIQFKAENKLEGAINNQFSMDENGEYFRIATTIRTSWEVNEDTSNSLYVLNDKLELVGELSGFGKGEKIYSVRYVDSKAYVVTFKKTDPLFVIDLSEPTNPTILGELKIPGYSTYLHPYDETHIIGFGYETNEDGERIITDGLKMVMFDVSDVNNPKELFKVAVGDRYTSSPLTYNHKALLYSKEKNIIAFPLASYSRNTNNTKAAIYEVDLEAGFILKGEISYEYKDYKQKIERIVYVNDNYFTLSQKLIKVVDMETLKVIKEIEI